MRTYYEHMYKNEYKYVKKLFNKTSLKKFNIVMIHLYINNITLDKVGFHFCSNFSPDETMQIDHIYDDRSSNRNKRFMSINICINHDKQLYTFIKDTVTHNLEYKHKNNILIIKDGAAAITIIRYKDIMDLWNSEYLKFSEWINEYIDSGKILLSTQFSDLTKLKASINDSKIMETLETISQIKRRYNNNKDMANQYIKDNNELKKEMDALKKKLPIEEQLKLELED